MEDQQKINHDEDPMDIGSRLRRARIAAGVELDVVAAALCIPASYVTAVEHNDHDQLPSAVFARGYTRAYARFLGISVDTDLGTLEQQPVRYRFGPLGMLRREARASDAWVRWISFLVLAVLLVAPLYWWQSQAEPEKGVSAIKLADKVAVETSLGNVLIDPDQQVSALGPVRPGRTRSASTAGTGAVSADVGNPATGSGTIDISASGLDQVSLNALFSDASWIEVRDAVNGVLFSGVKRAGERLVLSSPAIVDVVIGNAAAVQLSYNDAPVDLAGFTDERNVAKIKLGL